MYVESRSLFIKTYLTYAITMSLIMEVSISLLCFIAEFLLH
jgi:hypothetical protein